MDLIALQPNETAFPMLREKRIDVVPSHPGIDSGLSASNGNLPAKAAVTRKAKKEPPKA